ncbi:MAG: twin-arginine translocase subunit TatC [Acidobacteriota bacterium]
MNAPKSRGEMTFLEHFEELRTRITRALLGLVVAFAAVVPFMDRVVKVLVEPYYRYLPEGQKSLAYTQVTEIFFVYMKVAMVLAVVLAAPWIFYQLWAFIAPGLKPQEKRWAIPFVLATSFFFVAGVVFCYFVVLPLTFRFFFQFNEGFTNVVTVSYFWNFELVFLLALGLVFETPVLIFLLTRLGVVSTAFLAKNFKWAVLIAFIVAAVITPSGDPVTQTAVAGPMVVLYGLGILISFAFRKRSTPEAGGV